MSASHYIENTRRIMNNELNRQNRIKERKISCIEASCIPKQLILSLGYYQSTVIQREENEGTVMENKASGKPSNKRAWG